MIGQEKMAQKQGEVHTVHSWVRAVLCPALQLYTQKVKHVSKKLARRCYRKLRGIRPSGSFRTRPKLCCARRLNILSFSRTCLASRKIPCILSSVSKPALENAGRRSHAFACTFRRSSQFHVLALQGVTPKL